ncbi:MAG: Fpg/Nei family DNA glycosylase [Acidimicrobiia bacterium]|nr:DNA glycosylase [Acidimicrobiia bacterium]NNF11351.1 Fpg/Nei family DNA glycosylase [Acidimicrobiia bacterium]NNL69412.1 Fpg/Nei family DNA glycosylase [Acidimicrobiia bacterium]
MPEGDTLYRAARRLQSLVGQTATVEGTARAAQEWSGRLSGRRITSIFSRGKHLVVVFEGDLAVRSHLGMTGVWHLYRTGEQWRKTPGKARLVVTTADHVAVCFAAPEVSAGLLGDIEAEMAHLGPDLLADDFDPSEAAGRAPASPADSVADLLLDQRVMAGVGNVYKSEVLFLERLHPETPPDSLTSEQLTGLAARARKLLWANRSRPTRNTTGYGRNADLWVYGRNRRPCRRCGTNIERRELGELQRSTYWCPRCQPA